MTLSIKRVVSDVDRGGKNLLAVELRQFDVVDVQRGQQLTGLGRILRRKGTRQSERRLALLGREVRVPRREREPVLVAHRRQDANLEVEVRGRATSCLTTAACWASFWPKYARSGPDDVEELEADGCDAAEVSGAKLAFEAAPELADVDPGLVARRIHLLWRRREQEVDAGLLGERHVALLVARVAVEILSRAELGRIDEQARDDRVRFGSSRGEEREMPFVEGAHGRDEADLGEGLEGFANLGDRPDDLHGTGSAAVASARAR